MNEDIIQAAFNIGGCIAISSSIWKLYHQKIVRGIHWPMMIFFMSWSSYNIYFYGHLVQNYSFYAGFTILTAEIIYLYLLLYYTYIEKKSDSYSSYLEEYEEKAISGSLSKTEQRPMTAPEYFGNRTNSVPRFLGKSPLKFISSRKTTRK